MTYTDTTVTGRFTVLALGIVACVPGATLAAQDAGQDASADDGGAVQAEDSGRQDGGMTPTDTGASTMVPCDAGLVCGGQCVDVATDGKNCGSCGHDCQGGACMAGTCQPVVLALGQLNPFGIVTDGTSVYWSVPFALGSDGGEQAYSGSVMKCPVAGCSGPPTELATGQEYLWFIGTDGTRLLWAQYDGAGGPGTVMECPMAGCNGQPTVVAAGLTAPRSVTGAAGRVYWTSGAPLPSVTECSLTGCTTPAVLASGAWSQPYDVTPIAADATGVYWTTASAVYAYSFGGGGAPATTLATSQDGAAGIAIDGTSVYWTTATGGAIQRCAIGGCGGQPTVIASGQTRPLAIAVDATSVYWKNQDAVMRCPTGGCNGSPVQLASFAPQEGAMAIDATSVYWTNDVDGTVMKVAK
jgi:hypothetical protein